MRTTRGALIVSVVSVLATIAGTAFADPPLDLAEVDIATLDFGAGALGTPDTPLGDAEHASAEVSAGLTGAHAELLGLSARIFTFRASARPSLLTTNVSGTLADLDAWMIGARYPDLSHCLAFVSGRCDEDTGYLGFGGSVLEVAGDTDSGQVGMRFIEGDAIASVTPAFGGDWRKFRLLPRLGGSLDMVVHVPEETHDLIGRITAGFDALATGGSVRFAPTFRYRPSMTDPAGDFAIEATLSVMTRTHWEAWHNRDALTIGLELAYSYDSDPSHAFGPDRVGGANNSMVARLVVSPTIFTVGPP